MDGGPGVDRIEQDWNDLTDSALNLTLLGGADDGRPGEGDDVRNVEKLVSFHAGTFVGTGGADRIEVVQAAGPSSLSGGEGDDFLKASDGADRFDGGPGADTIDGGFNNDTIVGGPGQDTLYGDHPTGECGIYWCKLPAGNDTIDARDGEVRQRHLRLRDRHRAGRPDRRRRERLRERHGRRHRGRERGRFGRERRRRRRRGRPRHDRPPRPSCGRRSRRACGCASTSRRPARCAPPRPLKRKTVARATRSPPPDGRP